MDAFSASDPLPPGPLPYADITNPQSLNKYTYTWNNPLRYTDPDGHQARTVPKVDIEFTMRVITEDGGKAAPSIGKTVGKLLGRLGAIVGVNLGATDLLETLADNSIAESETGIEQQALESRVAGENREKLAEQEQAKKKVRPGSVENTGEQGTRGGSGKPRVHEVDHTSKKAAKEAARREGAGKPIQHSSPKKGKPHFHPTDAKGKKKPGSKHQNYPN